MKLKDILNLKPDKEGYHFYGYCRSNCRKKMFKYYNKDCVVAFVNNEFFNVILIKGIKKYFMLFELKDIYLGGYGYKMDVIDLKGNFRRLQESKELVVVNQEEYAKVNKFLLVNSL